MFHLLLHNFFAKFLIDISLFRWTPEPVRSNHEGLLGTRAHYNLRIINSRSDLTKVRLITSTFNIFNRDLLDRILGRTRFHFLVNIKCFYQLVDELLGLFFCFQQLIGKSTIIFILFKHL